MNIFALIQNGSIVNMVVAQLTDKQDPAYVWVDVTNYNPQPQIGWTTSDNINFVDPNTPAVLTTLQILEQKAQGYMDFGADLYAQITSQVWAVNTLAISQGQTMTPAQLLALLSASTQLQQTLESGSLGTAIYVISQLVAAFPQYNTIGANATAAINSYLTTP